MSTARDAFRQVRQFVDPRTLMALRRAGALDPRGPLALVRTLPWLFGRGPSLGVVVQMHARVLRDKPAIFDRAGELTWEGLDRRTNRAANALGRVGVAPGDAVATLLRNGREQVETILACQKAGFVASPLNTWAKPKELRATMNTAAPRALVYDTAHAEQAAACDLAGMRLVHVGDGEALDRSVAYEELLGGASDKPPSPLVRERGSARVVIHTSGTTGTPKGAARSPASAGMRSIRNILAVVPYRRDDVVLCSAPMFHSFGLATFSFAVALGATLVLPERFDPADTLDLVERHRVTAASMVPVMIRRIVSLPDDVKTGRDLSSLRILLASGSVLSDDLRRAATKLFGHVLYDLYGSTEVAWVTIATPEDIAQHPRSVGRPVPGVEVAVFSSDGRRLPPGQTGELYIRSDILFEGYTSGDTRDERHGFMSIGDVGHFDHDGLLYVESRSDDMVVVGGENVYPIEVEQVIEDLEGVEEVTVLGIPDEEYGQVLAAFVVGTTTSEKVLEACRSELASYKVPKQVKVVDELPRTSTGKVLKRELIAAIDK